MTLSEENYLKTIYHLSANLTEVSTNSIADMINTKASSVTDMLKKLSDKGLVIYKKYQGVTLSEQGKKHALKIIRKHRLWEVFLSQKLGFSWDEVHEVAEQLEHIESDKLIDKLDKFLNYPEADPHGDPIPTKDGTLPPSKNISISQLGANQAGYFVSVGNSNKDFLQYLDKMQISIGALIEIQSVETFDNSYQILVNGKEKNISKIVAENIYIKRTL